MKKNVWTCGQTVSAISEGPTLVDNGAALEAEDGVGWGGGGMRVCVCNKGQENQGMGEECV